MGRGSSSLVWFVSCDTNHSTVQYTVHTKVVQQMKPRSNRIYALKAIEGLSSWTRRLLIGLYPTWCPLILMIVGPCPKCGVRLPFLLPHEHLPAGSTGLYSKNWKSWTSRQDVGVASPSKVCYTRVFSSLLALAEGWKLVSSGVVSSLTGFQRGELWTS